MSATSAVIKVEKFGFGYLGKYVSENFIYLEDIVSMYYQSSQNMTPAFRNHAKLENIRTENVRSLIMAYIYFFFCSLLSNIN